MPDSPRSARLRSAAGRHPYVTFFLLAVLLNLSIESMARLSPTGGMAYLAAHPLSFLLNTVVLFATLSFCLLFRRRVFVLALVAAAWLALGAVNAAVIFLRASPLSCIDFVILRSCLPILKIYLRGWHVVLIVFVLSALAFLAARGYRRSKTYAVRFEQEVPLFASALLLAVSAVFLSVRTGAVETSFSDLPGAYENYGFVTCFSLTVLDRGIEEPENYSEHTLHALADTLTDGGETAPEVRPNIVAVQLESFMDPNRIGGAVYSESPAPFFSWLKERYPSGFLRVNTVGAGTANTEFEVLTGIDLTFFGTGEYPYQTVLTDREAESMASDLKAAGYAAHAIHDHSASFYDRYRVYETLGFDDFVPLEYMNEVERNPLGWAKDAVLTETVRDCLDSTDAPDFCFAVSVQGHGLYPDEETEDVLSPVRVLAVPDGWTESDAAQLSYYVSQVREMDDFLRTLVSMLEEREARTGESTLLLLYGDHLPPLPFGEEPFPDKSDALDSEYVLVPIGEDAASLAAEAGDRDLEAWEAGMLTLRLAGIREGLIDRCHRMLGGTDGFREALLLLSYDLLYGERYAWDGEPPFERQPLRMGVREIAVSSAVLSLPADPADGRREGVLTVRGEGFTPYSVVTVNERQVKTVFVSPEELTAEPGILFPAAYGDRIAVIQRTEDLLLLGRSGEVPLLPPADRE